MGKIVTHRLLPILLIIVLLNLLFIPRAHAAINYSNGNGTFSFSFADPSDLGSCSSSAFWRINLGYNDGIQVQGATHPISETSVTDSFSIPDGTKIQIIEFWGGDSEETAGYGQCVSSVANNSGGIFTWTAASGPSISNILVSSVTSSSVTVSWTTDAASDSTVQYGTTTSYGSTGSDGSSTTSHSLGLTSLSANTTYHYKVKSTNGNGTSESGDNTFATPASGTTGSNQSGSSTSSTAKATPTPVPDTIGPYISLSTDFSKPYLSPPQIKGTATDTSGVAKIEYSIDDGRNWNFVDAASLGNTSVAFSFTPPAIDDDNYKVQIRATDLAPARNVGTSKTYTLIIDRLPPLLIGNIISVGPQILTPTLEGYLLTSKGIKQKITISVVGGPTQIDLYANHPGAASESAQIYNLVRNPDNGLWSGTLQFDSTGIFELTSKSTDGAGNTTEQKLNKIAVLEPGRVTSADNKPVKDARVTLYYFEEKYQIWRAWDGNSYFQKNPQKTLSAGEFSYLLPSGKYYFAVRAPGFQNTVSSIFIVERPTILNPVFKLKSLTLLLDLGIFKLYLPDFSIATAPVTIATPVLQKVTDNLTNKLAPEITLPTADGDTKFDLFTTRGSPVVITFLNILSPQSYEQITALDGLNASGYKAYAVMLGNTISKTAIFKQNGGYKTPFVVDSDAKTVKDFQITTVPTSFFIDRRGVVRKIAPGIMNKTEMEEEFLGIQ